MQDNMRTFGKKIFMIFSQSTCTNILPLFELMEVWALIHWLLVDYSFQSEFLLEIEDNLFLFSQRNFTRLKKLANKTLWNHSHRGHMLAGNGTTSGILNRKPETHNLLK